MIKTAHFFIILGLINTFAVPSSKASTKHSIKKKYSSVRPNAFKKKNAPKKVRFASADEHIDHTLKSPSYLQPAAEITGYSVLALMGYNATKFACGMLASMLYPDAIKGALPTGSAAEKAHYKSAMNFITIAPVAASLIGLTYKSWPVLKKTLQYRAVYNQKKTWNQLKDSPAVLSTKEEDWEKITTKSYEQILEKDDAEHMALWIKQNKKDIDEEDANGRTLLHHVLLKHAANKNELNVAKMLLDKKAKIDGFKKRGSLLLATQVMGLDKAHELIKSSRSNCSCCHE